MRPEGIKNVRPKNVATFMAAKWDGNQADPKILWMAEQFGWKVGRVGVTKYRGRDVEVLSIRGKNKKPYILHKGAWVVALGASGSLRILADKNFRDEYQETVK